MDWKEPAGKLMEFCLNPSDNGQIPEEGEELSFAEACIRALTIANELPKGTPCDLHLEVNGMWIFRVFFE